MISGFLKIIEVGDKGIHNQTSDDVQQASHIVTKGKSTLFESEQRLVR